MSESSIACNTRNPRYTKREALIGAGVMIGASILFAALGIFARRQGWDVSGQVLLALAFPGALVLSMPFTFMKGSPRRVQIAIVGGMLLVLVVIGYLSAKF